MRTWRRHAHPIGVSARTAPDSPPNTEVYDQLLSEVSERKRTLYRRIEQLPTDEMQFAPQHKGTSSLQHSARL